MKIDSFKKIMWISSIILTTYSVSYGQGDTILIYNLINHQSSTTTTLPFDSTITDTLIIGSIGNWGNFESLNLNFPDSIAPGTSFSALKLTELEYDLLKYPTRTNVAITWTDSIFQQYATCSGSLIANNFVLTAAHCVLNTTYNNDVFWKNDMYVSPSHSNGYPQPTIGKIKVIKYFIFKDYIKGIDILPNDMALLMLETPIGDDIGWLGYGFRTNYSFFVDSLFYNFSYPKDTFGGFDMYYNYGSFMYPTTNAVWHGIPGIPGQSGSNFFYTNNQKHIVYGEYTYVNKYTVISGEKFFAINNIINNNLSAINTNIQIVNFNSNIYPNPFSFSTTLFINPDFFSNGIKLHLTIYDILGKVIKKIENISTEKTEIIKGNMQSGFYVYKIESEKEVLKSGKIIIE